MTTYGYARKSTEKQEIKTQKETLTLQGAEIIYEETGSGKNNNRKIFNHLKNEILTPGDTLIVTEISRLGRDATTLLQLRDHLQKNNIKLIADNKTYDFNTIDDNFLFIIAAAVCERETLTITQRLKRAYETKRQLTGDAGRPKALTHRQKLEAHKRHTKNNTSIRHIAKIYNCSPTTIQRAIKEIQHQQENQQ